MIRWAVLLGLLAAPAYAAAPPDADPQFADWFNSLKQPGTDISCCGIGDGHRVQYRVGPHGYQAFYGEWRDIPTEIVIRTSNPTGDGVLFVSPSGGTIYCFVPSNEI